MHDPDRLILSLGPFSLWHHDPCKDGTDDSCGWFKRARHGDKTVLEKITKDFEFDWDRTYSPNKEDHDDEDGEFVEKTYFRGLFKPNGDPLLSVHGIVINLFFLAALRVFKNRDRALLYLNGHLFEILFFAENPCDSLRDGIMRTWQKGCGEEYTERERNERIRQTASCIYAYIIRDVQKWWQHPKWHVHHWRITCRPFWRRTERPQTQQP